MFGADAHLPPVGCCWLPSAERERLDAPWRTNERTKRVARVRVSGRAKSGRTSVEIKTRRISNLMRMDWASLRTEVSLSLSLALSLSLHLLRLVRVIVRLSVCPYAIEIFQMSDSCSPQKHRAASTTGLPVTKWVSK